MSNGKRGVKSHKNFNPKRYRNSWQHHQYQRPGTAEFYEKVKAHYENLPDGLDNSERQERMKFALLHDVFAYVHRRDYTKDRTLRREDLDDIQMIIDEYDRDGRSILYVSEGKLPDGATVPYEGSRLCFADANRHGMPFKEFLLYLLGDDFVEKDEKYAALSDWTGIPAKRMEDIYLHIIATFFRNEANDRHRQAAMLNGGDLGFLNYDDVHIVYNFNVKASSGATVNINR